ncbi:MAG TPA: NAD(+)/NADH kinase [Vicinamibacterales bacterium]|nr:NAD(+)/NADH kinase [Vicinamibacterales bacterium]
MRRVGIVAKTGLERAASHLAEIASWLEARKIQPVFDPDTAALAKSAGATAAYDIETPDELPRQVEMIVVLGGDGTLLGTAGRIAQAKSDIPILGVNFGSLGFLTEVTLPEIFSSLETAVNRTAQTEERMMLQVVVDAAGRRVIDRIVLNDVVVTQGALSRIIALSVSVDGEFMMRVKADGLIVASPTGTTAYNLSAGGPIVHPQVDGLTITPIAPHTLTNRPVVVPGSSEIRIQPLVHDDVEVYATFDGQTLVPLRNDHIVSVRRADRPMRLIRASARGYFQVLREKLKWGEI